MTKEKEPNYKIHVLDTATVGGGDLSFAVKNYPVGTTGEAPCYSYLIEGDNIPPILVDTGVTETNLEILDRMGMWCTQTEEQKFEYHLQRLGYKADDIKVLLHTHLHIDHAGNDHLFEQAKIILSRKEMMWAASGIQNNMYPLEYMLYFVEQNYIPGRLRLLDGDAEIAPGIVCEMAGGHTPGSMNIRVNTRDGLAIICGDIIYNEYLQARNLEMIPDIKAQNQMGGGIESFGDWPPGNCWNVWDARWHVQKVLREADIVLPSHDAFVGKKYGLCIG